MASVNTLLTIVFALSIVFNAIQQAINQKRKVTLLEAQVKYLFEKTGVAYDPVLAFTPAIRSAVANGKKIEAIKLYRDATGSSLRTAKEEVEKIAS